jgi:ParB/RepB/Spo0J family partition protein
MTISISKLRPAPWNTHAKSKKDHPDFRGLVSSIKEQGIIQRIVVRLLEDGQYEIIDGHRRVEAAKAAGLKDVPCDIVQANDIDAQAMTATANIQRLENDPLLEAELIERMSEAGKTYKQIAATLGKSESYITRRARLTTLTEGWRNAVALAEEMPDISDLEMIAAHEPELQDKVLEMNAYEEDGSVDWDYDFEYDFNRLMKELDEEKVAFNIDECKGCKNNTATQGDMLFPELANETECGRCQNAECFAAKWNAATDVQIMKLRKKGIDIKEVGHRYDVPHAYKATRNKEPGNSVPYVFTEDNIRKILWSCPDICSPVSVPARTEEEIKAEKAEKKRIKMIRDARSALRPIVKEQLLTADFGDAKYMRLGCKLLEKARETHYISDDFIDDFAATVGGLEELPEEVAKTYAAELNLEI